MSRDWTFYLEDILECSGKVLSYMQRMTLDEFRNNDMVFDAVVRNLEIIGEAAKHLPEEATAMMPRTSNGQRWRLSAMSLRIITSA